MDYLIATCSFCIIQIGLYLSSHMGQCAMHISSQGWQLLLKYISLARPTNKKNQ